MASADTDRICGVCSKPIRDPYTLPCGHTFCLLPCLLSAASVEKPRCIHCQKEFKAAKQRPDYNIVLRSRRISLQLEQEQVQTGPEERRNAEEEEEEEDELIGESWTEGTQSFTISCSTCQRQIQPKLLVLCQHCQCEVCVQCRTAHRDSFSQMLRTRLDGLSSHKTGLKSRQKHLEQLKTSRVRRRLGAKGEIYGALEEAVFELRAAVSKVLNAAMERVESMYVTNLKSIKCVCSGISQLSTEVGKMRHVLNSQNGMEFCSSVAAVPHAMQEALATQKRLKELLDDAETLRAMVKRVQHVPITELRVSDQLRELDQNLKGFELVVVDEPVSPEQLPRSSNKSNSGDQSRKMDPPIPIGTNSRVKLYVGGLQPNHTEGQLRQHFGQFGSVTECCIARDYNSDESKCFGFVTFGEVEAASRAQAARTHLLGNDLVYVRPFKLRTNKDRKAEEVAVSRFPAKDKDEKIMNEDEGSEVGVGGNTKDFRLFVRYQDLSTSKQDLKEYFSRYGDVKSVIIMLERESKVPRGMAFISMTTLQGVEAVLEARPHQVNGQSIVVRPAHPPASKKAVTPKAIQPVHRLAVDNVPPQVKEISIQEFFSDFGAVFKVKMKRKKQKAIVTFDTAEALQKAMTSGPACIEGVYLRVSLLDGHKISSNDKQKVVNTSLLDGGCAVPVTDTCASERGNCSVQAMCSSTAETSMNSTEKVDVSPPRDGALMPPISDACSSVQDTHQTVSEPIISATICNSNEDNCEAQPNSKCKNEKGSARTCLLQ